jgi:hypothetical protein
MNPFQHFFYCNDESLSLSLSEGTLLPDDYDHIFDESPSSNDKKTLCPASPVNEFQSNAHRVVSMENITHLSSKTLEKSQCFSTPYESLKSFAESRKSQSKRTFAEAQCKIDHKTRQSTQRAILGDGIDAKNDFPHFEMDSIEASRKRHKIDEILHIACRDGHVELIGRLLEVNADAADASMILTSVKDVYDFTRNAFVKKVVHEPYSYPLNLAIKARLDHAVLKKLLMAAPEVIRKPDGPQREFGLHILLKNKPDDLATVDAMLLADPQCVTLLDRHLNTALHVACAKGAPLDIIRHLCILYPEALRMHNFHDMTPIQLAQRSHVCSDKVSTFLLEKMARMA